MTELAISFIYRGIKMGLRRDPWETPVEETFCEEDTASQLVRWLSNHCRGMLLIPWERSESGILLFN